MTANKRRDGLRVLDARRASQKLEEAMLLNFIHEINVLLSFGDFQLMQRLKRLQHLSQCKHGTGSRRPIASNRFRGALWAPRISPSLDKRQSGLSRGFLREVRWFELTVGSACIGSWELIEIKGPRMFCGTLVPTIRRRRSHSMPFAN